MLDKNPDLAVGLKLPFGPGQSDFALNYTTIDQAKTNLMNLLLTQKGERFMQPDFGTTLVDSLFEQNSEELVRRIQDGLNEDIEFWLPYIIVDNIEVVRTPDQHLVDVSLNFRVTEQGANQEIKIIVGENGMELNNNIL